MQNLELILKDIKDPWIRENFFRVQNYIQTAAVLLANFTFFEVDIAQANSKYALKHGLDFVPLDIVVLAVYGNFNYYFRHQEFDRTNIYITTSGATKLRFLAGRYNQPGYEKAAVEYTLVAPT